MNTKLLLALCVLLATGATSCKKEYTCHCKMNIDGSYLDYSQKFNDTRKNARKACDALDDPNPWSSSMVYEGCNIQ